ncbi:MAG: hypothetical protein WAK19_07115 [Candidatus Cybelea sp.]
MPPVREQAIAVNITSGHSWMASEAMAKDLLYVVDVPAGAVDVFAYPGGTRVGRITGFELPEGACVNARGDVFVTDEELQEIFEYPHGGVKPIKVLREPRAWPIDCAIDSSTNNLAVANFSSTQHHHSLAGDIMIYSDARGEPKTYSNPDLFAPLFCSYDGDGNLFITGRDFSFGFIYGELLNRTHKFKKIRLKGFHGDGIEWDGRYVAMSVGGGRIDRLSGARLVGFTLLKGSSGGGKPWIGAGAIVLAGLSNNIRFWRYPRGGKSTGGVTGFDQPYGAVVSIAKR